MDDWQPAAPTLRARAIRSGFVQIGAQLLRFVLGVGSGIAFARLLTPEDFGLLAIANSFILLVNMFRDMGLQKAAVQHPALDNEALSALLWLNLKLSAWVMLFMALMAWPLALFYRDDRLAPLILVLATGVIALNLAVQPESLLVRQMRFKTLSIIETVSMIAGIAVGIGLAWYGFGYWALAGNILAISFTRSMGIWWASGWRPIAGAKSPQLRSLLHYGRYVAGFRTLNYLSYNLDRIILGRTSGVAGVGVYNNAFRWAHLPLQQLYTPLLDVAVSTFSRLQDDPQAYRRAAKQALLPLVTLTMPLFMFMALAAELIIPVFFGAKWLESIPLFRLFALSALAASLLQVTNWLYLSSGETKRQFKWSLISAPVIIIGILAGVPWGTVGVALGFTAASWLLVYPGLRFCLQQSPLTMKDFAGISWRPVSASIFATITYVILAGFWKTTTISLYVLLVQLFAFGLTYAVVWLLLPGGWRDARTFRRLFSELRPSDER